MVPKSDSQRNPMEIVTVEVPRNTCNNVLIVAVFIIGFDKVAPAEENSICLPWISS